MSDQTHTAHEPARRRRLPPGVRRETILAAALDLFGRRNFDAVGMRDVAAACEMSATGIYRHFANKDALLIGLFDRLTDQMLDRMRQASRAGEPLAVLTFLIRSHTERVLLEPAMIPIYQHEMWALPPREQQRVQQILRDYLSMWTDTLMQVKPELPHDVARTTVVIAFGTMNAVSFHRSGLSTRALEKLVIQLTWRTLGIPSPEPIADKAEAQAAESS